MTTAKIPKPSAVVMPDKIEMWPTEKLIPFVGNARTHTEDQVVQIAASMKEFGFTQPMLVDSSAGIIAGHCRLRAAQKLGLTEVPVIVMDHLSDAQRRAYILADNQLATLAGWDNEILANQWSQLEEDGFDTSVIGFSEEDVAAFMDGFDQDDEEGEGETTGEGADDVPEPPVNPVTKPGDVWLLGDVHFDCPDCGKSYSPAEAAAMNMECRCG